MSVIVSHLEGKQEVEQLNPRPALSLCTGRCLLESSTLGLNHAHQLRHEGACLLACWHAKHLPRACAPLPPASRR